MSDLFDTQIRRRCDSETACFYGSRRLVLGSLVRTWLAAMAPATLRRWAWVPTWSSFACTVFLLMLSVTGLPLIFSPRSSA